MKDDGLTNRVWVRGPALIGLLASMAAASSALGAQVADRDEETQVLEVSIGDAVEQIAIAPGEVVDVSPEGCVLVLNGEEYDLPDGEEIAEITDGQLVLIE